MVVVGGFFSVLKIKGATFALLTMMLYCALEFSVGLWGSNYLVNIKHFALDNAARWIALYYGGITLGRLISGFISFKLNNLQMIRIGALMALAGVTALLLPLPQWLMGAAFVFIGLGFAPIFPAMLHETPVRFGKGASQRLMGFQMGFGYIGGAILPPLMGVTMETWGLHLFPIILVSWAALMLFSSEALSKKTLAS
jgi:fucose permease